MSKPITISRRTAYYIAAIVLAAIIGGIIVWQVYYAKPPTVKVKYTTGLTVKFKVYNAATYTVKTSSVVAEFYSSGVDPLGTRTFTTKPLAVASYDSVLAAWTVPLDAGTYVALVRDSASSKTFYPEKYTVTVTGTDNEDKETWLNPSQLNVFSRATETLSKAILSYNVTSGSYSISNSTMNITAYDKWAVTYTLSISDAGNSSIIKTGRFYMTKITGLSPTTASVDGTVVSVNDDTEASDDGRTGYYVEFPEMTVGEIHRIDVYWEDIGASTGTLTGQAFEYYECLRSGTVLRWWTDQSTSITVES